MLEKSPIEYIYVEPNFIVMSQKRKRFAQVQMVKRGQLTKDGCKEELCLSAQIELVKANRPKMLEAYNYKLHSVAERIMIEEGLHRLLKVYRYELDTSNQILLAKSNKSKLIKAYRFKLCPMAKNFIPKNAPSQQSTL